MRRREIVFSAVVGTAFAFALFLGLSRDRLLVARAETLRDTTIQDVFTAGSVEPGPGITQLPLTAGGSFISANPATHEVFVIGSSSNQLSVVNDISQTVGFTATINGFFPKGIGVNPITNKAYIAMWGGNLNEFNTATNALTEIIVDFYYHTDVAVNSVTNEIYAVGYHFDAGSTPPYDTDLAIVNGDTHVYTPTHNLGHSFNPKVVVNTVTNKAYIADDYDHQIIVVNGDTYSVSKFINLQNPPVAIAVNPATNRIYALDNESVFVIDGATDTLAFTVTVGMQPSALAVDIVNNKVYIANQGSGTISVINGETNSVETIDVGGQPNTVAIHPGLGRIYSYLGGYNMAIIDDSNYDIINKILASPVQVIGVVEGSNHVYLGHTHDLSILSEYRVHMLVSTDTSLAYTNTQGIATIVQIPSGAVTSTTVLVFTPAFTSTAPSGFSFAGRTFTLEAYRNNSLLPDFIFQSPITVTIQYTDADVAGLNTDTLVLRYWNDSAWASDGISITQRDILNKRLVATVAHLSKFSMFGEQLSRLYLPLILLGI